MISSTNYFLLCAIAERHATMATPFFFLCNIFLFMRLFFAFHFSVIHLVLCVFFLPPYFFFSLFVLHAVFFHPVLMLCE